MDELFNELRAIIVGKACCFIKLGFGSKLRIGIGEKNYYKSPKLIGKFHGEWDIISRTFSWRIIKDGHLLCGSEDEIENIEKVLDGLNLGLVSRIERERKSGIDFSLCFECGTIIDYFCCSTDDNQMIIMKKNDVAYELTIDGIYKVNTNEHFQTLTEIEAFISEYSDACSERWDKKIPVNDGVEKCSDCFYFRGIDGHFHFWDYGICSNSMSLNDGTIVGVDSGCQYHRRLKDIQIQI